VAGTGFADRFAGSGQDAAGRNEFLSTVIGAGWQIGSFHGPDLTAADILGSGLLDTGPDGTAHSVLSKADFFGQLLMGYEINRASPRTQSALLQACKERQWTVADRTAPWGSPFSRVLATQNPIRTSGHLPLPEARLTFLGADRRGYPRPAYRTRYPDGTTGDTDAQARLCLHTEQLLPRGKRCCGRCRSVNPWSNDPL